MIDPILGNLRHAAAQAFKRSRIRFPQDLPLPPGRRVYAAVVTKRVPTWWVQEAGYQPGELIRPNDVWLDAPPYRPEGDRTWGREKEVPVGATTFSSGWTDFVRVQ